MANEIVLEKTIDGVTLKCNLRFSHATGSFHTFFDLFIADGTDTDGIYNLLKEQLLKDKFPIDENVEKDIQKYSKSFFHNLKKIGLNNPNQNQKKDIEQKEASEILFGKTLIRHIEEKIYEESYYVISCEMKIKTGNGAHIERYVKILSMILSRLDLPSLERIMLIETEMIIKCRLQINPSSKEATAPLQLIMNNLYYELIENIKTANLLMEKILKEPKMLSILNQLFEKVYGFMPMTDIKRIGDAEFDKLVRDFYDSIQT